MWNTRTTWYYIDGQTEPVRWTDWTVPWYASDGMALACMYAMMFALGFVCAVALRHWRREQS